MANLSGDIYYVNMAPITAGTNVFEMRDTGAVNVGTIDVWVEANATYTPTPTNTPTDTPNPNCNTQDNGITECYDDGNQFTNWRVYRASADTMTATGVIYISLDYTAGVGAYVVAATDAARSAGIVAAGTTSNTSQAGFAMLPVGSHSEMVVVVDLVGATTDNSDIYLSVPTPTATNTPVATSTPVDTATPAPTNTPTPTFTPGPNYQGPVRSYPSGQPYPWLYVAPIPAGPTPAPPSYGARIYLDNSDNLLKVRMQNGQVYIITVATPVP